MAMKVFLIHGFEGTPNGGWRPWLMGKLAHEDIFACALAMPDPEQPKKDEWVKEISRAVGTPTEDIFLVGHSLGVPAILRYLETLPEGAQIGGVVLVSGPIHNSGVHAEKMQTFFETPFNFSAIQSKAGIIIIIHGDTDSLVPFEQAGELADKLGGSLIVIPNGGHLNGSSGWYELPEALESLLKQAKK